MPQPLRMYEPNRVYEITSRTLQGRFLLRPCAESNDRIVGVMGRAQELYPSVALYGVVVLSNHITWNLSSSDPEAIPRFIGFVNGNISKELGQLYDWPGPLWSRPHRPIAILDESSMVERFRYLLSQGVKEGLVRKACDWPGVSCVPTLLGGPALRGTWYERDRERQARRRGEHPGPQDFARSYEIRFARLPCWAQLSDEQYRAQVASLVEEMEVTAERQRHAPVLGAQAVMRSDPHHRPQSLACSPAPLCHAATSAVRKAFRAVYRTFVAAFREAARRLKERVGSATFPLYSFPPGAPMVRPETLEAPGRPAPT